MPPRVVSASAISVMSSSLAGGELARSPSSRTPGGASHLSRPSSTESRTPRSRRLERNSAVVVVRSRSPRARPAPTGRCRAGNGEKVDDVGQSCDRRLLEEVPHRCVDVESRAQLRDDLGGLQRVAAEVEEIVLNARRLDAEHVRPDGGDARLGGVCVGRRVRAPACQRFGVRRGQRLAVDLAVRGEGQRRGEDEVRRHHVLGQLRPGRGP